MKIILKEVPLLDDRSDQLIVDSIINTLRSKRLLNLDEGSLQGTINNLHITFSTQSNHFLSQIFCDLHDMSGSKVISILSQDNYETIKIDLDDLCNYFVKNNLVQKLPKTYKTTIENRTITVHINKN